MFGSGDGPRRVDESDVAEGLGEVAERFDVVLSGEATTVTWIKTAVTYLVPFCVANYGLLAGSHRPHAGSGSTGGSAPSQP